MKKKKDVSPVNFLSVTIVVPCYNEEESVSVTVESLLALDYPRDKLNIIIVDDGSTDNTLSLIQKYRNNPIIDILRKENGGKHTALNFAISRSQSDIIGCLDADSFVDPDALKNIVSYFSHKETMAVVPAIKIYSPDNILRKAQKVEYDCAIFLRKMLSFLDALYVTPGPFSFFRREVFTNLGPYKQAHNTEDMEIAMRMQSHGYKIKNCHTAFVYTIAPHKFSKLFTQRLRWTYGFLKNAIDYRGLMFNKKQGNLGLFVLPVIVIYTISTLWMAGSFLLMIALKFMTWFINWRAINFDFHHLKAVHLNFQWFYLNTSVFALVAMLTFIITLSLVLIGRKLSEGKIKLSMELVLELVYFFAIYPSIAPFWVAKSVYQVLVLKNTTWR